MQNASLFGIVTTNPLCTRIYSNKNVEKRKRMEQYLSKCKEDMKTVNFILSKKL
jgi:hypothetical protein